MARRALRVFAVAALLSLLAVPGWGQSDAGYDAYKRGDYATAHRVWKSLAEGGDASAQYNLGLLYHRGLGVERRLSEAAKWYGRAAENGDADAQKAIGDLYVQGFWGKKNSAKAATWYRKAAGQGHAGAKAALRKLGAKGKRRPRQAAPSQVETKPAPDFNHDLSAEELDLLVGLNGVFSWGSFKVTIRNGTPWRLSGLTVSLSWNAPQAVEKQSGLAAVGLRLQEGSTGMPGVVSIFVGEDLPFVPRGRIEYSWNLVGAVGIDPDTLDDTSVTDAPASEGFGKGRAAYLRKDYATALQVFRPLADEGHSLSQFYLGILYSEGGGVPKDYSRALRWWHKAAQQGSFHAEQTIGMAYSNGEGVKQNFTEAAKWYRKAAESGLAEAQHSLGVVYSYGKGVPQDDVQAARWFAKSAAQGYPLAQHDLAMMIMGRREGVPHDLVEALKWLILAARHRHRAAIKALEYITKNPPPAGVMAEADRRVSQWRPRVQPDRGLTVWW